MASKEVNAKYYKRNRKYILLRKKLIREGKSIPTLREIPQNNGQILIKAGELTIAIVIPSSIN